MNSANSKPVWSSQASVHPALRQVVDRRLRKSDRYRPAAAHTQAAFTGVQKLVETANRPVVLDSGCGNGDSSVRLAQAYPRHLVIGVDKSAQRLRTLAGKALPDNCILARADLRDFWRLAEQSGWRLDRHFILYPNPWPKQRHLPRRWHGSPSFPHILALGGTLELRTNWHTYALEFAAAMLYAGHTCTVEPIPVMEPLTPFEAKYRASGHTLWLVSANLLMCMEG